MRWNWAFCLWPGLPQLWQRGAWSGLALAAGFALGLNVTLLCTLVWTEWVGAAGLRWTWLCLGLSWGGTTLFSLWSGPPEPYAALPAPEQDLFPHALNEYLRGNWFAAEGCLARLLEADPGDVDARFLLVGLLRRTGRGDAARRELERLERFDRAVKWRLEIERERQGLVEPPSATAARPPGEDLAKAA
jgi:hypothetical protein